MIKKIEACQSWHFEILQLIVYQKNAMPNVKGQSQRRMHDKHCTCQSSIVYNSMSMCYHGYTAAFCRCYQRTLLPEVNITLVTIITLKFPFMEIIN